MATAALGTTTMVVAHNVAKNATYTGRLVNNKRDGRGACNWPNGQTYDGEWRDNNRHGRGVYTWPDGETHDGEYHNDKRDGWGVNHRPGGSWYEGLWRDAKWKRGTWHTKTDVYDGEWAWNETTKGHEMQGWGAHRRRQLDGERGATTTTVYEGEWDRDKWHGSGTWVSPDGSGDIYHGTFDHGKRSGTGRMLFGDKNHGGGGGSYVGEWKDDKFHGRGVRLWANGDRYEGQWVCGKEDGEGTKTWSRDGSSFTGLWEMGEQKKGTRRWPNGDMFEGTFTPQPQQSGRGNDGGWTCCGEGIATLSASSEGNSLLPLKGILNNNKFQQKCDGSGGTPAAAVVQYQMGSSVLWFRHHQQIENLKTEHTNEKSELEAQFKEEMKSAKNVWEEEVGRLKEEIARSNMEWEQVTKRNHQQHVEEVNQLHQKIQQQQQEQLEGKGSSVLIPTNVGTQDGGEGKADLELNQAMKLTTQFQALLKKSAPELMLLRESLAKITKHLQEATQCNEALRSHLQDLNELKDLLEKQLDETCETSKRVLGQTLTVQNSEAEIQQCSRSISELTKKVLASKHPAAATTGENLVIPLTTKGKELLMVTLSEPSVLDKISVDFHLDAASGLPQPFQWLGSLSDTLGELQGCRFEECTKLADQKTMLSKELSDQITLGLNLHKEIEEIKGVCTKMTQEHKTKWMLMRGLEGDEQFIALPCVWSMLSELLPQAQQAVVDLMVSKAASMAAVVSTPSMPSVTTSTLPGCTSTTSSSSAGATAALTPTTLVNKLCMECDENPPNVQFQPCGHIVLCSQCAAVGMRKCLVCRTPIQQKNVL